VPFVVPTIPVFSFTSDGVAGVGRNLTPARDGFMSRIGGSLYAFPPDGMETAVTAWGFWAGPAPTGASSLTVLARVSRSCGASVTASAATPAPGPPSTPRSRSSNPLKDPLKGP
jgi:hypothetical protein